MAPLPRELKIKILRAVQIGNMDAMPGEIYSVSRVQAAVLVGDGFAILLDAKQSYTVTVETPEHGDPAPRRIASAPPTVTEKAGAKRE
jgi:hypothetical protein